MSVDNKQYTSVLATIRKIVMSEGPLSLYKVATFAALFNELKYACLSRLCELLSEPSAHWGRAASSATLGEVASFCGDTFESWQCMKLCWLGW